jgi:hypothetical protein
MGLPAIESHFSASRVMNLNHFTKVSGQKHLASASNELSPNGQFMGYVPGCRPLNAGRMIFRLQSKIKPQDFDYFNEGEDYG